MKTTPLPNPFLQTAVPPQPQPRQVKIKTPPPFILPTAVLLNPIPQLHHNRPMTITSTRSRLSLNHFNQHPPSTSTNHCHLQRPQIHMSNPHFRHQDSLLLAITGRRPVPQRTMVQSRQGSAGRRRCWGRFAHVAQSKAQSLIIADRVRASRQMCRKTNPGCRNLMKRILRRKRERPPTQGRNWG